MENDFKDAFLLTAPAAFGEIETGFGKMNHIWGPFIIIFCLLLNVLLFGVILAYANDYVRNLSLQEGRIEKKVDYKGHIVICGWNYQGNDIIKTLQSKDISNKKEIVVLAENEKRPFKQEDVAYIKGSPLEPKYLERAGIEKADSAIILTDFHIEKKSHPDDKTFVISTLIRKDKNEKAYISVQLVSSKNEEQLKIAGANTIVCLDKLGGSILAFSAEYHGILKIVKEILFSSKGSNIIKLKIDKLNKPYLRKTFSDVGKDLLDEKKILLAFETEDDDYVRDVCKKDYIQGYPTLSGEKKEEKRDKVLIINPQGDYKFRENDHLFIISEEKVTKKESSEHIVICGWNDQGYDIVETLRDIHKKKITIFSDYEFKPIEKQKDVSYLIGSPLEMKQEDVEKAGLDKAESVIILTDIPIDESTNPDDKAFIITTLIKEKINKNCHVSVQLLSSKNEKRLQIAGADTIVCPDVLSGWILAFSAEYHGTLRIIKELLYSFEGSEIYKTKQQIPDYYLENFHDASKKLLDKKMILIAVETKHDTYVKEVCKEDYRQPFTRNTGEEEKVLIVNPQGDYKLRKGDCLFIIAEKEETTKLQ